MSSATPFLADNDHDHDHDHGDNYDEEEVHLTKNAPANSYYKRSIKILSSLISVFSFLIFGLLIAAYVLISIGPFTYTYSAKDVTRDLAICLIVNVLVTAPTIFYQLPILIAMSVNLTMSIVIFIFSSQVFTNYEDSSFCYRYSYGPPPDHRYEPLPETKECQKARSDLKIIMGVSAGCGILIGILILSILLLRAIALAKTRFWEGKSKSFGGLRWKPSGFTVQFTLSVLPHGAHRESTTPTPVAIVSSVDNEGRLIDA